MSQNSNPLADKDPITQYRRFKKNIKELNLNIKNIVKNIQPMIKAGLTNGCNISRMISDKICQATDLANKSMDGLNMFDIMRNNKLNSQNQNLMGGAYQYIQDPSNGEKYNINSKEGIALLKNYIESIM